eukprot:Skav213815  [mRNA]  locus=scaffold1987:484565:485716:- [translate_table: standard]
MAPKKGTKRPADEEVVSEAKKLKETLKSYGVSKTLYDGVVEALQHPEVNVPQSARAMLIASLLEGICVPASERHSFQSSLVEMVEQTLQGVLAKLKTKVEDATAEVSRIEEAKAGLQGEVQAAEESLAKATDDEKKSKEDLAEATRGVLAAKTQKAEQEKLRIQGDAAHEAAKAEKAAIETALAEEFRLLSSGTAQGDEAKNEYKKLEKLAASSGMEDSLLTALPTSILKPPAERGSFDAMVVAQLQEGLLKRSGALQVQIQQGEPAAAERLARVEQACKDLEAARVHQEKMAEIYMTKQGALKASQDAKEEAESKVKDAEPRLLAAKKSLEDAALELENYQVFNWGCFEQLRDHAPKPAAPAPKVESFTEAVASEAVATAGA